MAIFTVTAPRRRLLDSTITSRVRLQLAALFRLPAAAVTLSTAQLSAAQHQIEARVDTGVDGAAAEAALRTLRGTSTHGLEVALGLELASPPLLRLDRIVVRSIPPSPPPRPPALPPLPPSPVRATRRLTTRRGSTACH